MILTSLFMTLIGSFFAVSVAVSVVAARVAVCVAVCAVDFVLAEDGSDW